MPKRRPPRGNQGKSTAAFRQYRQTVLETQTVPAAGTAEDASQFDATDAVVGGGEQTFTRAATDRPKAGFLERLRDPGWGTVVAAVTLLVGIVGSVLLYVNSTSRELGSLATSVETIGEEQQRLDGVIDRNRRELGTRIDQVEQRFLDQLDRLQSRIDSMLGQNAARDDAEDAPE